MQADYKERKVFSVAVRNAFGYDLENSPDKNPGLTDRNYPEPKSHKLK